MFWLSDVVFPPPYPPLLLPSFISSFSFYFPISLHLPTSLLSSFISHFDFDFSLSFHLPTLPPLPCPLLFPILLFIFPSPFTFLHTSYPLLSPFLPLFSLLSLPLCFPSSPLPSFSLFLSIPFPYLKRDNVLFVLRITSL